MGHDQKVIIVSQLISAQGGAQLQGTRHYAIIGNTFRHEADIISKHWLSMNLLPIYT